MEPVNQVIPASLATLKTTDRTRSITQGVLRLLTDMNYAVLVEFPLKNRRRVDIIALDTKGKFTIIEVKSGLSDFRTDKKWHSYLPFCDLFYFATATDFPTEYLPQEEGLMIADAYGAAIVTPASEGVMTAARRKALTLRFARIAAQCNATP